MNNRTVILIAGPTAVGKTAMAVEVARAFQSEIISADSRQCYRELRIGVARPSEEELAAVSHHFIASHSVLDELTAAGFEDYAMAVSENMFARSKNIVLAGGTGLYIRAFLEGLDAVPAVPTAIRESLTAEYNLKGREWLRNELTTKDSWYAMQGDLHNPQRMLRALEVFTSFGKSILSYHSTQTKPRSFRIIRIGLTLPREELYRRINSRVEHMIDSGLIEEVKNLEPFAGLSPLQTVGYRELFPYFKGEYPIERAVSLIQQNTRHYAKRQLTWFRNQESLQWFHPEDIAGVIDFITEEFRKQA